MTEIRRTRLLLATSGLAYRPSCVWCKLFEVERRVTVPTRCRLRQRPPPLLFVRVNLVLHTALLSGQTQHNDGTK
jgi:hypothetical protein